MRLNTKEIMEILPHRAPFLLIDRIDELEPGKRAVASILSVRRRRVLKRWEINRRRVRR